MFNKKHINITNDTEVFFLNVPSTESWNIFNKNTMIKQASKTAEIIKDKNYFGGFDIEAEIKNKPDFLYIKVFAIKEDEVNDNGDYFCKDQLKKYAHTFIGVPVFVNHQNDDIEKARGKVVHAWYDENSKGIYTINAIDRVMYPKLARGIETETIFATSMGCSVTHSVCSICHNNATTSDFYCSHIKNGKNRKFSGKIKCNYFNSKELVDGYEDKCPICTSTKEASKELVHNNERTFEHNYGLKFIEDSMVNNPACSTCLVQEIINPSELSKKVAELQNTLRKVASSNATCVSGTCRIDDKIEKLAGKEEINLLSEAMDKIEKVAKSMLAQKAYVSMEYVSDLVKSLAEIQDTMDELLEVGYAQLPSPNVEATSDIKLPKTGEDAMKLQNNSIIPQQNVAQQMPSIPSQPTPQINTQSVGTAETAAIPGLGSVTKPKNSSNQKKEFLHTARNIINIAENINGLKDKLINYIEQNTKENRMEKVAKNDNSVITEKQLENAKGSGERTNDSPDVITEKQMENYKGAKNETTSDSPVERKDNSPDVITEKQLDSIKSGYVVRWNDFPKVITEKQWTDANRMIGSVLSESQSDRITEKQLIDFLSQHKYNSPDVITEKQLDSQKGDLAHTASFDAGTLTKVASEVISDAIARFQKTPQEISKAASYLTESVENKNKAAFISLINALPNKKEARSDEKARYQYFSKLSSIQAPSAIDALILSVSDNLGTLSADELLDAVKHVASIHASKEIRKVAELVTSKLKTVESSKVVDKVAQLNAAIEDMNKEYKENDGIYLVKAKVSEIGVPTKNKVAFIKATEKFASKQVIADVGSEIKVVMTKLDLDDSGKFISATMKDVKNLTKQEKVLLAQVHNELMDEDLESNGFSDGDEWNNDGSLDLNDTAENTSNNPFDQNVSQNFNDPFSNDGNHNELSTDNFDNFGETGTDAELHGNTLPMESSDGDGSNDTTLPAEPLIGKEKGFPSKKVRLMDGMNDDNMNMDGTDEKYMDSMPVTNSGGMGGMSASASRRNQILKKADKVTKMTKESQRTGPMFGGTQPDQMTSTDQTGAAAGDGAAAGADAPVESFSQSTPGEDMNDMGDENLQAKPPGSICPVCGSEDVDIVKGSSKCNNCGSEFYYKVEIVIPKWAGILDNESKSDKEEGKDEIAGEGLALGTQPAGGPPAAPAPSVPAAPGAGVGVPAAPGATASTSNEKVVKVARFGMVTKLKSEAVKKIASAKIGLGTVSPLTGKTNTIRVAGGYQCLDTGVKYDVEYIVNKKDQSDVRAQWSWNSTPVTESCESCSRKKSVFAKALKGIGLTDEKFESLSMKDKADKILEMKKAGSLSVIKTASVNGSEIIEHFQKVGGNIQGKFPIESCRQAIALRWGENGRALSGPYEGQKLVDCICNSLKKASVYSNGLAVKVAEIWADKDACEECQRDFIRGGYEVKEAQTICDGLAYKYASLDDVFAQELGKFAPEDNGPNNDGPDGISSEVSEEDPFDQSNDQVGEGMGSVTLELPMSVLQKLDEVIDKAIGENPAEEAHHQEPMSDSINGEVQIPEGIAEKAKGALEEAVGAPVIDGGVSIEDSGSSDDKGSCGCDVTQNPVEKVVELEVSPEDGDQGGVEEISEIEESDENKSENSEEENKGVSEDSNNEDNIPGEVDDDETGKQEVHGKMASRTGQLSRNGEVTMDLSLLQAKLAKKVGVESAQDAAQKAGYPVTNKEPLGHEDPVKGEKFKSFTGNATIGGEKNNKALTKDEMPDVPAGDAKMGDEGNTGEEYENLDPELTDKVTGGDKGQGKSANSRKNTKDGINALADGILSQLNKKADTKVVVKLDQDQDSIKPYQSKDGGFLGDEKASIGDIPEVKTPTEVGNVGTPKNEGFIGDEKASIGKKPTDKDTPSIPTSDARIKGEKDNAALKPEIDNQTTGLKAASTNQDNIKLAKKAVEVAGKMLQNGSIKVAELSDKIAELSGFSAQALNEIEKQMNSANKGLKVQAGGIEQALIISEASTIKAASLNAPKNAQEELKEKLQQAFSLSKKNEDAEQTDFHLYKRNGR
jgi:hypothetical protein